jgi:hypothetical protein
LEKIRIVKAPPGIAPRDIREKWVGVEIPLATEEEKREQPPSRKLRVGCSNLNGYIVLRRKAVIALREAGKNDAAAFWERLPFGRYLEFEKEVCEVI